MNEAPQKEKGPRTNDDIKAAKVLLIDEHGEKQGVMPLAAALDAAREASMDLVEVSPNQEVPVVKILDYGKLRFEERKKKAAAKKKQKNSELKEIKMRPNIDTHDYEVKAKAMTRFFEAGRQGEGDPALPRPGNGAPASRHGIAEPGEGRLRRNGEGGAGAEARRPPDDHGPLPALNTMKNPMSGTMYTP
jgi:hypothetical protein